MNTTSIKQGQTLAWTAMITDDNDQPIIGLEQKLSSDIRFVTNELVGSVSIRAGDVDGQYILEAPSTNEWPVGGTLFMDVKLTDGGVSYSDTIIINVERRVTR